MSKEVVSKGTVKAGEKPLANALRFERAKNKVLLDEVLALEDELVNRDLQEFEGVLQDDTRDFWRDQLLQNRTQATVALKQMQEMKLTNKAEHVDENGGKPKPMHNRKTAKPVQLGADAAAVPVDDGTAAVIRNRAHEIRKNEGVPFSVAFRRAEREISRQ